MTTTKAPTTSRIAYDRTLGVAAMEGRGFYYPWSAAIAADGRIFVLGRGSDNDPRGVRVTVMNFDEEYFGTFGKFGTGQGESIWNNGIAIDAEHRLYTTDESLDRVHVRNLEGELLDTWGESGSKPGQLRGPTGVTVNSRNELLISDHQNGRIQFFTCGGAYLRQLGEPGSGDGQLNLPWGVSVDSGDNVFVADWGNDRVVKFSPDGEFIANYGSSGRGEGQFNAPSSVCVDADGYIYVTDWGNHRLQVLDSDGNFIQQERGQSTISKWAQEFLDTNVEEAAARAMSNLEPDMVFNTDDPHEESAHIEKLFWGPTFVMTDSAGHVFVIDSNRHRMQVYNII